MSAPVTTSPSTTVATAVPCPLCGASFATAQQAATCLCRRRRYITTLGIRLGVVPTAAQLKGLTSQSAQQVTKWYNSRLSAAQRSSAAQGAPAPHQVAALQHLGLPVPATALLADQALIAAFKSKGATNARVWAMAQALSKPQPQQLSLF